MTEWQVVGVIVVLVGLAAVIKPVVCLNASITRLNGICAFLEKNLGELTQKNSQAHDRLWQRADEHEAKLQKHDTRLTVLEKTE